VNTPEADRDARRKGRAPDANAAARGAGASAPGDFVRAIVADDVKSGRCRGPVHTRFPPEPNGYLHIGHAKAICIDFGVASEFGGLCNLRMDDTNPCKEETEFVEAIIQDIRWLGFDWGDRLYYASDYYEQLYQWAVEMVKAGKAYVCDLSADQVREYRGTLTRPGRDSPYRNRSVEENLDLLARMKAGEFPDGSRTLRAKIDMASPNIVLRDPVMYRILHAAHHRTGTVWSIYPMYDWAHGQNDWMEGITHSICTLEYEIHRPLYDWFIATLDSIGVRPRGVTGRPRQIEFARLNLTYTVMSKRKLLQLVREGHVRGWDDPRMPTLCGLRRRGYTAEAIREFCRVIGVAKMDSTVDIALLEHCLRDDLNRRSPRVMVVLRPLKLVIDNYPEGQVEHLEAINNPEDPSAGTRMVPFSRELYIEREDFMEEPPKGFFRLAPGREVRLRYAYFVKCERAVKDPATGEITELHCTYDPATRGGDAPDGRKVKATLHWVSAAHAVPIEARLYDHLFTREFPEEIGEAEAPPPEDGSEPERTAPGGKATAVAAHGFLANLNPHSLQVLADCRAEPSLANAKPGERFQFERLGYFCVDPDSTAGKLVFNRTVGLKDTWARMLQAQKKQA
jgi:glutaminyl-tRNA synthetase